MCYQDFRGMNLSGQSFEGQDLSGRDFSECDIRGTNFKGALLRGAKFRGAKAGLQKCWAFRIVFISLLISAISGFLFAYTILLLLVLFEPYDSPEVLQRQLISWISLIWLIIFYIYILGIRKALEARFVGYIGAVALALAGTLAVPLIPKIFVALGFGGTLAVGGLYAVGLVLALFLVRAIALAYSVVGAVGGAPGFSGAFILTGVFTLYGFGSLAPALLVTDVLFNLALKLTLTGTLVSVYLGWRAIKEDPKDNLIRIFALALASTGGTSFYNADLTDADFTGATLKNTDLRAKSLTNTCFQDTIKLHLARLNKLKGR